MDEYFVIARLQTGSKDRFEAHRIVKKDPATPIDSQVPQDHEIVFGPLDLDHCSDYIARVSREKGTAHWFGLTVAQYLLIGIVTVTFVAVIVIGAMKLQGSAPGDAANLLVRADDSARVLITFLVAVATVAIAFLAILTAMMLREYRERFALAKEVLTLLVGILGTIVGFYFGTAGTTGANTNVNTVASGNAGANGNGRSGVSNSNSNSAPQNGNANVSNVDR